MHKGIMQEKWGHCYKNFFVGMRGQMKIAFWSNVRGQAGVTTNMICVSALITLGGIGRTVLLENHYSAYGLSEMLLQGDKIESLREYGEYFNRYSIEYIMKRLYSGEDGEKLIHQASIPLLFSNMYYVPQSQIVNREVFEYEFHLVKEKLFEALETTSDYVFVDTEANRNLSTNIILEEADLVVVNLDQNPMHVKEYFDHYASLQEKTVFLVGNYRPEVSYNVQEICKEYSVERDRIVGLPYHFELEESVKNGTVLSFLNRSYFQPMDKENEYFIRQLKRACKMIRKKSVACRREKMRFSKENQIGEVFSIM